MKEKTSLPVHLLQLLSAEKPSEKENVRHGWKRDLFLQFRGVTSFQGRRTTHSNSIFTCGVLSVLWRFEVLASNVSKRCWAPRFFTSEKSWQLANKWHQECRWRLVLPHPLKLKLEAQVVMFHCETHWPAPNTDAHMNQREFGTNCFEVHAFLTLWDFLPWAESQLIR